MMHLTAAPYGVKIWYCWDWEEYQQARVHYFGVRPHDDGPITGVCSGFMEEDRFTLLIYFNGDPSTLVHECAHAVFDIFKYAGIRDAAECNNEPFCYLLDNLFDRIWSDYGKAKDEEPQGGDLPANGTRGADSDDPASGGNAGVE